MAAVAKNRLQSHSIDIHDPSEPLPFFENEIDSEEFSENETDHEIEHDENKFPKKDKEMLKVTYPADHKHGKDMENDAFQESGLDLESSKKIVITIGDDDKNHNHHPYDFHKDDLEVSEDYSDDFYNYDDIFDDKYHNIMPFKYWNNYNKFPFVNRMHNKYRYRPHYPVNNLYNPHLTINNGYNYPLPIDNRFNFPFPIKNRFNKPLLLNNYPLNNHIIGNIGNGYIV